MNSIYGGESEKIFAKISADLLSIRPIAAQTDRKPAPNIGMTERATDQPLPGLQFAMTRSAIATVSARQSVRVELAFPIAVPGGEVAVVNVRRFQALDALQLTPDNSFDARAMAFMAGIGVDTALDLDLVDADAIRWECTRFTGEHPMERPEGPPNLALISREAT